MPSEPRDTLTNKIRQLRFANGEMTQQTLAEKAGVTRQTVIALEAGKYVPSLLLAFRLSAALGVKVDELFLYERGQDSVGPKSGG